MRIYLDFQFSLRYWSCEEAKRSFTWKRLYIFHGENKVLPRPRRQPATQQMDSWDDLQNPLYLGADALLGDWAFSQGICIYLALTLVLSCGLKSVRKKGRKVKDCGCVVCGVWSVSTLRGLDRLCFGWLGTFQASLSHLPGSWLFLVHQVFSQCSRNFPGIKSFRALEAGSSTEWLILFLVTRLTWRCCPLGKNA